MSNDLSIAVVTAALKKILGDASPSGGITVKPLDKAASSTEHLNIFLYHTSLSAAWRNRPVPGGGNPPLPLVLYYLITAYSADDEDDLVAHRILGRAMSLMHDHPILTGADLQFGVTEAVLGGEIPPPDVMQQIEHIRMTWHPLSLEELSRLWGGFQTALRFSVAYEVSVVLIDSLRPAAAPLPVLQRGRNNEGVPANANLDPTTPTLESVILPAGQSVAQDGDTLTLNGYRLIQRPADTVRVLFDHPLLPAPLALNAAAVTETEATVVLSAPGGADWRVGVYTVSVETTTTDPVTGLETRTTNVLPLAIGPNVAAPLTLVPNPPVTGSSLTVTMNFTPDWHPGQRARLLYDGDEIALNPISAPTAPTGTLTFDIPALRMGKRPVRLRIDGIESRLIPDRAARPLLFDPDFLI